MHTFAKLHRTYAHAEGRFINIFIAPEYTRQLSEPERQTRLGQKERSKRMLYRQPVAHHNRVAIEL